MPEIVKHFNAIQSAQPAMCLAFIQRLECCVLLSVDGTWRALENNLCIRRRILNEHSL